MLIASWDTAVVSSTPTRRPPLSAHGGPITLNGSLVYGAYGSAPQLRPRSLRLRHPLEPGTRVPGTSEPAAVNCSSMAEMAARPNSIGTLLGQTALGGPEDHSWPVLRSAEYPWLHDGFGGARGIRTLDTS